MNKLTIQLVGATIGAAIGYWIGNEIVAVIRYNEDPWGDNYHDSPDYPTHEELERKLKKNSEEKQMGKKQKLKTRNYTRHYVPSDKPELAALIAKYRGETFEDVSDETTKDATLEVEEPMVEVEEEESDEDFDQPIDFEETDEDPCVIPMELYAEDDDHRHFTLNYYSDDILTDERNRLIPNPKVILGDDALVSFGLHSQDEDVVYVRNRAKRAMYEVVRTNEPYTKQKQQPSRKRSPDRIDRMGEEDDHGEENTEG